MTADTSSEPVGSCVSARPGALLSIERIAGCRQHCQRCRNASRACSFDRLNGKKAELMQREARAAEEEAGRLTRQIGEGFACEKSTPRATTCSAHARKVKAKLPYLLSSAAFRRSYMLQIDAK